MTEERQPAEVLRAREWWLKFVQGVPRGWGSEADNRSRGDWVIVNPDEAAQALIAFARQQPVCHCSHYEDRPYGRVRVFDDDATEVAKLQQQLAEARAALKQVANCSCEEGHTCVRVAREIAQQALEPK